MESEFSYGSEATSAIQIIQLTDSFMVTICPATNAQASDFQSLAVSTNIGGHHSGSTLLGLTFENHSERLARGLSKTLGTPVFVSFNLHATTEGFLCNVERKVTALVRELVDIK